METEKPAFVQSYKRRSPGLLTLTSPKHNLALTEHYCTKDGILSGCYADFRRGSNNFKGPLSSIVKNVVLDYLLSYLFELSFKQRKRFGAAQP